MIKVYLKQALTLMKQHRLFSGIYILGTGLSIALVMTLFIIFYVKFAPIYPEYNRNRILVLKDVKRVSKQNEGNWSLNSGASWYVVKELMANLQHCEALAAANLDEWNDYRISLPDGGNLKVAANFTNSDFWRVFNFNYVEGHPYTSEQVEAKEPVAVLSVSLSKRLFATTATVGRKFFFNGKEFTVCGVVEDVSNATPETVGDLWVPLTHSSWITREYDSDNLMGSLHLFFLAPSASDKEALRNEILEVIHKYNQQNEHYVHDIFEQPDEYWLSTFRSGFVDAQVTPWNVLKSHLITLLAFLIIPALNLSGMISSRMDSRMAEIGVRKAYGATDRSLVSQVLWENLLLTCIGGLVGLLLSYLIVLMASDWILTLFDAFIMFPGKEYKLTFEMLFNPVVFTSALLFCVILNLFSALIPTVWALRRSIISAIHAKR